MKIRKDLELDLTDIPADEQDDAKNEVGELLVNEIFRSMESGKSPVDGEKAWAKLDKQYAKDEHKGNTKPTLTAKGDLRESVDFRVTDDGVEVGIFDEAQEGKADGHNNFSGKSKLPQRRFIPDKKQTFTEEITGNIDRLLDSYREVPADTPAETPIETPRETPLRLPAIANAQLAKSETARLDKILRKHNPFVEGLESLDGDDLTRFLNKRFNNG